MLRSIHLLEHLLTRFFSLVLIASVGAGLVFPGSSAVLAPYILPLLMLVIYLGFLKTDYSVLLSEIRNWKRQLWLNTFCLLILPSLLYLAVKGLEKAAGTSPAWGTGVLLLFACPVAALGPTLALVMKGHFERTLCTLILTSLIAPLTLPLLLLLWEGTQIEVGFLEMTLFLVKLILVPFAAAQITLRFFKKVPEKLNPHTAALSVLFLSFIVIGAVDGLAGTVFGNPGKVLEGVAVSAACLLLAYVLGWLLHPPGTGLQERSTLSIVATWTNIGLSIVFAKQFFPGSDVLMFVVLSEIPWNLAFAPAQLFIRSRGLSSVKGN